MPIQKLIAGNWKMNGGRASARALASDIARRAEHRSTPSIALCPPFPLISLVGEAIAGSSVALGGQDCHQKEKGPHTGDVSASLLADLGCTYVIVGHSERRTDHGEGDAAVAAKATAALAAGLKPIICVGETDAERERGQTRSVVERQIKGSWPAGGSAERCVIAYEPVWAIGTGKTPTLADVEDVHRHIRLVAQAIGVAAEQLAILYGGSVKGSNAKDLLAVKGVDGALVGGASLDAEDFWKIVSACG